MKKILFLILVVILIAGAGYGGYWYGAEKSGRISSGEISKTTTQEKCSSTQPTNLCLPGESTISDVGQGLKKFRSERYGIEFNFPSNYQASVSHSFEGADVVVLSSTNDLVGRGSIRFAVKYNPTFADPLEVTKQSIRDCEESQKGVGVPCSVGIGNPDTWKKVIIDDKSYGYRTGIHGDPMLTDSFYAISSITGPKGSKFEFDAFLPEFDSSKAIYDPSKGSSQLTVEQVAAQDLGVQKFLGDFDQIIKSIKFFSIFKD